MKLQLLIPQYKETEEIIKPLLDSIALQQNVDFSEIGVIICNDGSDTALSDAFLNAYPYQIQYIKAEHKGVSAARNRCLDAARADYVMFCDADDMFYNACGLYILFREIAGGGFNAFASVFVEETRHPLTKEPLYINHEMDSTFVHGKAYNREFLLKNNIRWDERLTIHEDSYFNILAQKVAGQLTFCPVSFYLWKWRDDSVCRHDEKYILKTYNNMLDSSTALVKQLLSRGLSNDARATVCQIIYDAYFTMNKKEWVDQENQEYRRNTERRFKRYFDEFRELYEPMSEQDKAPIIMSVKNQKFQEGLLMESITFDDWIKQIEEMDG